MARDPAAIVSALNAFPGQKSGDLRAFENLVLEAMSLPPTDAVDEALFGIFERFPEEDGHGVYWSIVHGFEGRGAYEPSLLASVRRCPSPFALLMLNRMCNAGATHCAGEAIVPLLEQVVGMPSVPAGVRQEAQDFIDHQRQRGET